MKRTSLLAAAALLVAACGTSVFDVGVGDCFDDPSDFNEVSSLQTVDCAEPHDNEVYAVFDYTASESFPGEAELQDFANEECVDRFESFIGFDYFQSELDYGAFWPSAGSWDNGDREIMCFAYELDLSKIEGTLAGAGR